MQPVMHAPVVVMWLVLSLKMDPEMVAVMEWRPGDSLVQPLSPAVVVVLPLVLLRKTDATMVVVRKCNRNDELLMPFPHALVVVRLLVWFLKINAALVVKDMAKTAEAATVVGCLNKISDVPQQPTAVVMCLHEDALALPPMHRFSVALQLVCYLRVDAKMSVRGVTPLKGPAQESVALPIDHGVVPPRESVFRSVIFLFCERLSPHGAMIHCLSLIQTT